MEEINLFFEYRDKKYTLSELIKAESDFFGNLNYIKPISFSKDFVAIASRNQDWLKNYIIYKKYESLIDKIFNARFALLQAYKKLHKSPLEWKGGYHGQLFVRSQFLFNSILTYQSIVDNLYQIIYFHLQEFDFKSREDYLNELRKVSKKSVEKILIENDYLKEQFEIINSSTYISKLNKFANNYKHHSNITVKGLKNNSMDGLINFNDEFSSNDLKEVEIDIDEYCEELSIINNLLTKCAESIWEKINFEKLLNKTDKGYEINL